MTSAPVGKVLKVLVDAPTVRVEAISLPDGRRLVLKRYFFPRVTQRLRGAMRHSWLGAPKALREADNLRRLSTGGAPVLLPVDAGVRRGFLGFVRESWLLLPWMEGSPTLAACLPGSPELWERVGQSVRLIHEQGCRYRDLRPRNLLVGEQELHWLDASKSRWEAAPLSDSRAAEDLVPFLLPAEELELLPEHAWSAFTSGYGRFQLLSGPSDLMTILSGPSRKRVQRLLPKERKRLSTRG